MEPKPKNPINEISKQDEKNLRIGFIGAGNMAQALAKGFINSGYVQPDQISASAPSSRNLKIFQDLGCHTTNENENIFKENTSKLMLDDECQSKNHYILFICVKPTIAKNYNFWKFLVITPFFTQQKVILVSVLAGVTISSLYDLIYKAEELFRVYPKCRSKYLIARIMPNLACSINVGAIGLCYGNEDSTTKPFDSELPILLAKLGFCKEVSEDQLHAVCGLASSGIAFVYSMIQSMSDGGVLVGLPRQLAVEFATQTILGACSMVKETGSNPIELRNQVCSPSGTTITGINVLERGSFNATVMEAIKAATYRSKEFS